MPVPFANRLSWAVVFPPSGFLVKPRATLSSRDVKPIFRRASRILAGVTCPVTSAADSEAPDRLEP